MPVGVFVPSRIHIDYPEWQAPLIGNVGQVWAYDGTGYVPVALDFDPTGTAAAAVAAHVALSNPHSQYYLASGVSAYGATLIDDADAAAARTTLGLGTMAVATETAYLLADGSRAGATAARQAFTNGITTGSIRPESDSTTAVRIQNAGGTHDLITANTVNNYVRLRAGLTQFYAPTAGQYFQISTPDGSNAFCQLKTSGYMGFWFYVDTQLVLMTHARGIALNAYNITNGGIGITSSDASNYPTVRLISATGQTTPLITGYRSDNTTIIASMTQNGFRIAPLAAPTTPNAGDIWYPTGGRLSLYRAATEIFATGVQATGGAATAGASYTSAEQTMLQRVYDAARAFGLLS